MPALKAGTGQYSIKTGFASMVKFFATLIGFCIGISAGYAQFFGGNPSRLKWQQIKLPEATIIYPQHQDSAAQRVAAFTQQLEKVQTGRLGNQWKPISVVLQPDATFSNAYVSLGPWRSEYYLTPPQDPFELGSIHWADNLVVHEWKHVDQFSNFNRGFSKVMGVIGGQQGRALANVMAVPDWFFEGDAVWNETVYTNQGRGRLPYFYKEFKSLQHAGFQYNWQQLRNGSLRKLMPGHYQLGYLMVAYGRQQFSDSIWTPIVQDASAFKQPVYPLQKAIKKHTGLSYSQFTSQALQFFNNQFASQQQPAPQWLTPQPKNNVVNYRYPYATPEGGVVVLKASYRQIPMFYHLSPQGVQTKIDVKDIGYEDYYSYRNGRIVYTALQPDKRWGNRDYSVVRIMDVATRNITTLQPKTKLFSPDIDSAGQTIVAVEVPAGGQPSLRWYSTTGDSLYTRYLPDVYLLSHPKFTGRGQEVVVAARLANGYMGIALCQPQANTWQWLLPPAEGPLGFLVTQNNTVLFTATRQGVDAVYSLPITGGQPSLLAQEPTGIYQACIANGQLVGSVFTAAGYRLAGYSLAAKPSLPQGSWSQFYTPTTLSSTQPIQITGTPTYTSTRFRKTTGFFNLHSWRPELSDPAYTFTFLGNNILNTTQTEAYYTWNRNERSHALGGNFIYGGWYLQPFVAGQQTWGREVVFNRDTTFIYNETEVAAGIQLPLNLSFGRHYRRLVLSSSLHAEQVRWQGIGKNLLRNLDFNYLRLRAAYGSQIQRARQHIFPRFAYGAALDYRTIINQYTARQLLATANLTLPGFWQNHNILLTGAYQGRDTLRQYVFTNSFPFSRGYQVVNFPRMWRLGINYHLPLFYPEWGFGHMLYFLRVRANLFYDYTAAKSLRTGLITPFGTTGTEVYFDTRIWNQLPVTFGVRYSRLLNNELARPTQANRWELILPVDLF